MYRDVLRFFRNVFERGKQYTKSGSQIKKEEKIMSIILYKFEHQFKVLGKLHFISIKKYCKGTSSDGLHLF